MKRIAFVPDIHMETPGGDPYYRVAGVDGATVVKTDTPWMARQLTFLLERLSDPKFVDGKEQIEGEILRDDARGAIKRQAKQAEQRGYWEFEDDTALRLANATMKPGNPFQAPQLAFNYVPFIRAVRDMTTPEEDARVPA